MDVILGIDIGGSTTKIVGLRTDGSVISMLRVRAEDQVTSLYGALGNYLTSNRLSLCLSRGFTGRYKFDHSGRGTGSFRNGVVESDGEQMLLFEGRNGDGRIARAVFSLEGGGPYALDIPASPVFLVSTSVDDTVSTGPISIEEIVFYDSQGRDITKSFDLSGGAIQ